MALPSKTVILDRLRLLRTKLALPGWILLLCSLLYRAVDVWGNLAFAWGEIQSSPFLSTLLSQRSLTALAFVWFVFVLLRPNPQASPVADRRSRITSLLDEAAAAFDALPKDNHDFNSVHGHMVLHLTVQQFITAAFLHPTGIKREFDDWLTEESDKSSAANCKSDPYGTIGQYLRHLSRNIERHELDQGFQLPPSFDAYAKTDKWPANTRPL